MFILIKELDDGKSTNICASSNKKKLNAELKRLKDIRFGLIAKRIEFDSFVSRITSKYNVDLYSRNSKVRSSACNIISSEIQKLELELDYSFDKREIGNDIISSYYFIEKVKDL